MSKYCGDTDSEDYCQLLFGIQNFEREILASRMKHESITYYLRGNKDFQHNCTHKIHL